MGAATATAERQTEVVRAAEGEKKAEVTSPSASAGTARAWDAKAQID